MACDCCCLLETLWALFTAIASRSWGTDRDFVQAAHDQLAGEFGRHAFRLRGVEAVTSGVLGVELRDGWAQAQVSKVILLREALNRLSARHESLATRGRKSWGHILAASLLGRGATQRACYVFAEKLEYSCAVIWDLVRVRALGHECRFSNCGERIFAGR